MSEVENTWIWNQTIGGVLRHTAQRTPANDAITALWALDARLTLRSLTGERTLPLEASCARLSGSGRSSVGVP